MHPTDLREKRYRSFKAFSSFRNEIWEIEEKKVIPFGSLPGEATTTQGNGRTAKRTSSRATDLHSRTNFLDVIRDGNSYIFQLLQKKKDVSLSCMGGHPVP